MESREKPVILLPIISLTGRARGRAYAQMETADMNELCGMFCADGKGTFP